MPTTSNFGWTTPADTDLVKDGALAIRTLGNGIDTSMAQLKGGTTGQVLSKTSNTDMAFTWVTQDDANAIQNAIVDAKGDLIAATANDTPARLAVGNNGETLVADSSTATGLRWQGNFAAGKNAIINGDFRIWQRGTSFNISADSYTSDRWISQVNGNGTRTVSQQTFTPGTAPVAGYEGQFFLRMACSSSGTATYFNIKQKIEDVRSFAGQTVTVSFWAKASASLTTGFIGFTQDFGSGGSSAVDTSFSNPTFTTSWARYTFTTTIPSISGKTIGTGSNLAFAISFGSGTFTSFDLWGVQVEAGSVATAFQTATGTLAGELAACQRYYFRFTDEAGMGSGLFTGSTNANVWVKFPQTMRVAPTSVDFSGLAVYDGASNINVTNVGINNNGQNGNQCNYTVASGGTTSRPVILNKQAGSSYLGFSAEL